MGVIDDAVRLVRDIDRRVLQLDAVIAEDRPNVIANEGVRLERQLERLTASAERLRTAARRLMRNSGDGVYKIRLADRDAPPPPPWIRRTRPGREVVTYMTNSGRWPCKHSVTGIQSWGWMPMMTCQVPPEVAGPVTKPGVRPCPWRCHRTAARQLSLRGRRWGR